MRQCEKCGEREFARERQLKRCARCKIVLYCSEKCQKEDWHRHKSTCKPCENPQALPKCGLCGNRKGPFTRTECCNRLICDDEDSYRLMSYSRIHCIRSHRRYTICGHHHSEEHRGTWQDCKKCKKEFREWDKTLGYEYASRAGNPPHVPFKVNFDKDVMEFNWDKIKFPKCDICLRPVDTMTESFFRCPGGGLGIQCEKCVTSGRSKCDCFPKMHVKNSMEKY